MKALIFTILALFAVYFIFTLIAPSYLEKSKNKTTIPKPYEISDAARTLFTDLDFVADLHCDALLWDRNLTKKLNYGHVDFPRMQEGNVALQAFTIVTKSPAGQNFYKNDGNSFDMITALSIGQGQAPNTWFNLFERARYQCKKLHRLAASFNDKFVVVKSKADFQKLIDKRAKDKNVIGGFLGVEGAHCLEGKLENFDKLYEAGVRMLGPTHFFDNEMGGSAHGLSGEGLTAFGFDIIQKMNEKNMIMDVAHSSEAIIDDVLAKFTGPILTSHTGVKGTFDSPRNLSDRHLREIADRGGLIGIAYFPGAIGKDGISGIVRAMKYTKDLIGVDHLALGSDFDGSVTVPFDVSGFGLLVDALIDAGFTEVEIRKIMGQNVKDFLLKNLP